MNFAGTDQNTWLQETLTIVRDLKAPKPGRNPKLKYD